MSVKLLGQELADANLEVKHRDLSHPGKSSPSVYNKFVVESDTSGKNASGALTGGTNWTTQRTVYTLNNVLIVQEPDIAGRNLDQWGELVAAGN